MAAPIVLQKDFSAAIRRDRSRDQIGGNAVWDLRDYIPNRLGAPLTKRGGWSYHKDEDNPAVDAGRFRSICDGPFNGGHYLLAVDENGVVYRSPDGSETFDVDGTTRNVGALKQNPYFFLDDVIFPSPDGSQTLSRANESTVVEYDTGTYIPEYITGWKGHLVGAAGELIVFGPPQGPLGTLADDVWDADSVYAQSQPIKGLKFMHNALVIFYDGHTDRMRGNRPVGYDVTEDDLIFENLFSDAGLIDAFSLTGYNDQMVWADKRGVYISDGAGIVDLTASSGCKEFYRSLMDDWTTSWRVAGGMYSDQYWLTITDLGTNTFVEGLVFDLKTRTFWRNTNVPFTCYASNTLGADQTWAGIETVEGRVAALRSTLEPTDANSTDADGTNVLPYLETAYYRFGPAAHRLVDLFVSYQLTDDGDTTPDLSVKIATNHDPPINFADPADETGTLSPVDAWGEADDGYHYKRVAMRQQAPGMAVQVTQGIASADTRIYSLSATYIPKSGQKSF